MLRGFRAWDAAARYFGLLRRRYANVNFNPATNGEYRLLRRLSQMPPKLVFDVGANVGDWTAEVKRLYAECHVHAFEIVPSTFQQLRQREEQWQGVTVNGVGLSSEIGQIKIFTSDHDSLTATANPISGMADHDKHYTGSVMAPVTTGQAYMMEHGIEKIDFLKIDVEGMELEVLRGFGDLLAKVAIVQFEYGIFNIASKALLYDLHRLLTEAGFTVGKLYPRTVEYFDYHYDYEDFLGGNYIAVRDEATASILAKRT